LIRPLRQNAFIAVLVLSAGCAVPSVGLDAAGSHSVLKEIHNTEEYFPDEIGSVWRYRGHSRTDMVERIAETTFSNEVSAIGTTNIKGETVKIFRETNQGNKGPTDGFFRRDKTGITYYGSQPTTPFEQQLVPYRVLAFPLVMNGTFRQLEKRDVDIQADLDGDGHHEQADIVADVRVVANTPVTVPAGPFNDAVQIDATMTIVISLTKDRRVVTSQDRITSWFVRRRPREVRGGDRSPARVGVPRRGNLRERGAGKLCAQEGGGGAPLSLSRRPSSDALIFCKTSSR
jgi:hypothetical protein